jgi:hypothetical protein
VKEAFKTTTKDMTNGAAAASSLRWLVRQGERQHRPISRKQAVGRQLGWSWFDAANPQKTASIDDTTDYQSCHVPARQSDWIYTSGYSVLTRWAWVRPRRAVPQMAMPAPDLIGFRIPSGVDQASN